MEHTRDPDNNSGPPDRVRRPTLTDPRLQRLVWELLISIAGQVVGDVITRWLS